MVKSQLMAVASTLFQLLNSVHLKHDYKGTTGKTIVCGSRGLYIASLQALFCEK